MSTATKPNRPGSSRPTKRSGGGGGGFWILIAAVVLGVAGVYIFAPELPRQWFGTTKAPVDKGAEPTAPQQAKTDLANKTHKVDDDLTKPKVATTTDKPKVDTQPAPEKPKAFADEAKAAPILEAAQKAYTEMKWSKAAGEARRVVAMAVSAPTRIKAQDIIAGSAAIEKLFHELNDKDELTRYYDTHPSLVLLKSGSGVSQAVPITSIDDPTPVETRPLDYIAAQRKTGKVAFLIKGKKDYIPSSLPADVVGEVVAADTAAIMKEKQAEFETRLNRLRNSNLARDPLAWYDAGKFAYRNRLDGAVTEMLNQAVVLDQNLVSKVREDKAAGYYANVVSHLKNGNKKQADAFMAIITRKFADTDQGKQARLYYDGKNDELIKAAKAEQEKRKEEERQRREALKARATELGDEKALTAMKQEPQEEEQDTATAAIAATGDEGKADTLFAKGRELYNKALDAGNTPERDVLYEKAYQELHAAQAIYSKLVEKNPNDTSLGLKLIECNKLHYGTVKQRRFH
jgi:hypothetical protein